MSKRFAFLLVFLIVLSSFTVLPHQLSPVQNAAASSPFFPGTAWENATASYTNGNQNEPSSNLRLWAANNSTGTPLNLTNEIEISSYQIPSNGLAYDMQNGLIYATTYQGSVLAINPASNSFTTLYSGVSYYALAVAYDNWNNCLYVLNDNTNLAQYYVQVVSISTGTLVANITIGSSGLDAIIATQSYVYVGSNQQEYLYVINATSNTFVKQIGISTYGYYFSYGAGEVFVTAGTAQNDWVSIVQASAARVIANISQSTWLIGSTYDVNNGYVYISAGTGAVYTMNPTTNAWVSSYSANFFNDPIAFDPLNNLIYGTSMNGQPNYVAVFNANTNQAWGTLSTESGSNHGAGNLIYDNATGQVYGSSGYGLWVMSETPTATSNDKAVFVSTSFPDFYSYNGHVGLSPNTEFGSPLLFGANGEDSIGTVYANLTANGNVYGWSYTFDYKTTSNYYYVYFVPSWSVPSGSQIQSLNITMTAYYYSAKGTSPYGSMAGVSLFSTSSPSDSVSGTELPLTFDSAFAYGWNYDYKSVSSSYSLGSSVESYSVHWSSSQKSNSSYNSLSESGISAGIFAGTMSVTVISFSADFMDLDIPSYTISYFLNENLSLSSAATGSTPYQVIEQSSLQYFNATLSFALSFTDSGLTVSSSHPISWEVNVSHLLNEYPTAPYNSISFSATPADYSKSTYGSDGTGFFDFIFYYNSTSSSAESVTFTVTTTELVNYYPAASYYSVKYSGRGSTADLIVNATNPFDNETLQISNINWGDGSPTQSSVIETPTGRNWNNFSFSHQYTVYGTFTVTFLVVNAVGDTSSLSWEGNRSITLSVSITYTSNALPLETNQKIFFNYTQFNLNLQEVYLYINNILAQSSNVSSNTNYEGTVSYSIPYYLTQTAEFTAEWEYEAGGISGTHSIQYAVTNSIPTVGLWVLLNYTIGTGLTATKESVPYFYTQQIHLPGNDTWSYYVWQILLPGNSVNITVKGSTAWKSPVISVPADFYQANATFRLLINTTQFQVTWVAPDPAQSALVDIEYYPQTPIWGLFGVNIPFSEFNTYLNGHQIYSPTQSVDLGSNVVINTTTIYGTLLSSYSATISQQTQFIEIPLNMVPFTVMNMNSSYVVGLQVSKNGIAQSSQFLMPLSTNTMYAPAGTYNFSFTYLAFNSYSVSKYYNVTITLSSVSYLVINGETLSQLGIQLKQTQQNITQLVENVNITLSNSNDKIASQIVNLSLNVNNENSSIIRQLTTLLTGMRDTNSTLYNQTLSLMTYEVDSNTTIHSQINSVISIMRTDNSTLYNQTVSLSNLLTQYNSSIYEQIVDTLESIRNTNSTLYNEVSRLMLNLTNTNSTIYRELLIENTTVSNVLSKIVYVSNQVNVVENNVMSDINATSMNVTTRETTIKDLVSLSLQEENSTFSYQLKFGTPSVVNQDTYRFPVFVTLFNGQIANLSVTQQAWQNLKLYYVTGNDTYPLNYSVGSVQPGSFVMTIYNVTKAMAEGITANQALITAQGRVKEGVLTNLAAGIIGSQQIQYSPSNIWTEIFGISPPNENNSAVGVLAYLSWLQESYAGRAIYLLVVFAILAYYAIAIDLKLKEKERRKNSKGGDDAKSNAR